jgi:cytochrome c-type biogenesis protein CcmH
MMLWLILASMMAAAVAAIAALAWPVLRGATAADCANDDATSARRLRRAVLAAAVLLLPTFAGALYLRIGSSELSSTAAAAREQAPSDPAEIEGMVAQVEAHLQRKPNDGRAWEILAPVYMRLGQYEKSVRAWRNAQSLLGESAERQENLGESLVAAAGGSVTAEATAAFVRAVAIDGNAVAARYYLGLAAEQDGRREEAAKIWGDLVAAAPAEAHWVGSVRAALARLDGKPAAGHPGPTAQDMQAAAKLPPDQQDAMIRGMVDRLAARLKSNGDDLDGWIRLVRSYGVLGAHDSAATAAADARRALAAEPEKLARLEDALKSLPAADAVAGPGAVSANAGPGPSAEAMAAADTMAPEQRAAMIRGMVDRLAARLKQDGGDVEGWLRLTRSYAVIGERDKARDAVLDARKSIGGDAGKLRQLDDGLKDLGLE